MIDVKRAAARAQVSREIILRALRRKDIDGIQLSTQWLVNEPSLDKWIANPAMHKRGNPAFVKGRPQGSLASRKTKAAISDGDK